MAPGPATLPGWMMSSRVCTQRQTEPQGLLLASRWRPEGQPAPRTPHRLCQRLPGPDTSELGMWREAPGRSSRPHTPSGSWLDPPSWGGRWQSRGWRHRCGDSGMGVGTEARVWGFLCAQHREQCPGRGMEKTGSKPGSEEAQGEDTEEQGGYSWQERSCRLTTGRAHARKTR